MNCPHCGAEVIPGHRFCQQCRKRVADDPTPRATAPVNEPPGATGTPSQRAAAVVPAAFARPMAITILAVLNFVGGVFALIGAVAMAVTTLAGSPEGTERSLRLVFLGMGLAYLLIGAAQIATGYGLLKLRPWARTLQIAGACLGLLGIPCGTIVSVLILVYMLKPEVRTLFSDVSPRRLPPAEVARVQALSEGSAGTTVAVIVGVAVVGLVAVAMVGIIAAIAIPSLLRARLSANEAAAIGDVRGMVSAQSAYQSANNGFYDTPACLAAPSGCIPGYPGTGPTFLDADYLQATRHGYRFQFVTGTPATEEVAQRGQVSPSSVEGYAYLAVPIKHGQTGLRSFCGDASGAVCSTLGAITEAPGHCPSECEPLQ